MTEPACSQRHRRPIVPCRSWRPQRRVCHRGDQRRSCLGERHTAAVHVAAGILQHIVGDVRLIFPALRAGLGVQCVNILRTPGAGDIKRVANNNRESIRWSAASRARTRKQASAWKRSWRDLIERPVTRVIVASAYMAQPLASAGSPAYRPREPNRSRRASPQRLQRCSTN